MRISANTLLVTLTILGIVFIYLAVNSAKEAGTVWNAASIIFILIASMEFLYAFRILQLMNRIKKINKRKK
ncbi:DUF4305 domain-containing protein [Pueribacillus sp. YX66]|uniref:DUF4305 domain-containing protein n=1 Tax=Pueribacillus sp. YX66 TaxID=3229242 RepID=UPI00358CF34F